MPKKRPTPHERRAVRARYEQEQHPEPQPTTLRKPWVKVFALLLVVGMVLGTVGSAVIVLLT
jgi:hypothetical protein